jgi:hypothetical protein
MELQRPKQADLDRMSHVKKDALILQLFDELGRLQWRVEKFEGRLKKNLPPNLSIGKQVSSWRNDTEVAGFFGSRVNGYPAKGKGKLLLHERGVSVGIGGFFGHHLLSIHESQILDVKFIHKTGVLLREDSFVGTRTFVGGILFGPLAGMAVGLTGVGASKEYLSAIELNYRDKENNIPRKLILLTKHYFTAEKFCNRLRKSFITKTSQNTHKKTKDISFADVMICTGVFFIPIVFSWFTLLKRFSTKCRMIAFLWLFFYLFIFPIVDPEIRTPI